jgi:hypothetical protein
MYTKSEVQNPKLAHELAEEKKKNKAQVLSKTRSRHSQMSDNRVKEEKGNSRKSRRGEKESSGSKI